MLRSLRIENYKSIVEQTIDCGRINVFIGENGSGKSNVLEALAMASAVAGNKEDNEELYSKGIRLARPANMFSSFPNRKQRQEVQISCKFDAPGGSTEQIVLGISPTPGTKKKALAPTWRGYVKSPRPKRSEAADIRKFAQSLKLAAEAGTGGHFTVDTDILRKLVLSFIGFHKPLLDFAIFNPNTLALRGLQVSSRKTPLGINGENLDVFIASLAKRELTELTRRARCVSWMDQIVIDDNEHLKLTQLNPSHSTSTLYFVDKLMNKRNNILSAEIANEGILHVLFYLALFGSRSTPSIFGIDNIETALNPQLCRELLKQLVELAQKNDKQAFITTQNPAVLDGLNLHDDDQRLFVVYRNDRGYTTTKRIRLKPKTPGNLKLSELWMRGHLGAIPKNF